MCCESCSQLYVGDYSFTVGSLFYVATPCDDPSKHCAALIGGIVGGVGGLIVIVVVVIICLLVYRYMERKRRRENCLWIERDPVHYYTC